MFFLGKTFLITQRFRCRSAWFRPSALAAISLIGIVLLSTSRALHAQQTPQASPSLNLKWQKNPPIDLTLPGSRVQSSPQLPQELPDFDQASETLGVSPDDPFMPWRLATVIVRSEDGWGSGAFISADGWLLTNYHVVASAAQKAALEGRIAELDIITARIVNGRTKPNEPLAATLYRADPIRDLALLKLNAPSPDGEVGFFEFGEQVVDGEDCYVLGSQANGPAWWLRSGTVSQQFDYPEDLSQYAAGVASVGGAVDRTHATVVVTDARISGGDSGGPLLNKDGRLIGLTYATPANSSEGSVGWHIALAHVQEFVADLPAKPEGVPFDLWSAGFPASSRVAELQDADSDGRVDSLVYVHYNDPDSPLAVTVFFDLGAEAQEGLEVDGLKPQGLWGAETEERFFRLDFFLTKRADEFTVVGYPNENGMIDDIRIAQPGHEVASVVWRRDDSGSWRADHISPPVDFVDESRLDADQVARLAVIAGDE